MQYPEVPFSVQKILREVPVTESDVLSWNTIDDLCRSHAEGDVIIAPNFFEGDCASLIFSKRGNYARLKRGKEYLSRREKFKYRDFKFFQLAWRF